MASAGQKTHTPYFAPALLLAPIMAAGCANPGIQPNLKLLTQPAPYTYSDQDWAAVLNDYVKNGLVDYAGLANQHEALDRYYALLGVTGPALTPDQFPDRPQAAAYWINAYNALVLMAVLQKYPASTMYDLSLPRLEYEYMFKIDGQRMNLAQIEEKILDATAGDVRALFATSRAAMGTPPLSDQPFRATALDKQLGDAAANALDDPHLLRIDHTTQSILVWQLILRREPEFIRYWEIQRRIPTAYLFNVLLELTSPEQRRALQSAVGYSFREISFDRSLNQWTPANKG